MRIVAGVGMVALALLANACSDDHDRHHHHDHDSSAIVFGIEQAKGADGKTSTTVGYEFLDVLHHGFRAVGLVSRDRSCWAERLDDRLGHPRVAGGVATFEGGALPDKGIAIVANRPDDLVLQGHAWATGDWLTFQAQGFAMPDIAPQSFRVPATELVLLTPAAPTAPAPALAIDGKGPELAIAWAVGEGEASDDAIVASLTAIPAGDAGSSRGVELRCFFDRPAGQGTFPADLLTRFVSLVGTGTSPITGTLRVATHRQLTIEAAGGWTVYVVASVAQREQPFTLQP